MLTGDGTSNTVTFTLEAAATAGAGRYVMIKALNIDNTVDIAPDGAETIDGAASFTFSFAKEAVWLVSDGSSNWEIYGRFYSGGPITVAEGGTGATTLTDHGILVGSGTGAITPLAVMTDGQLVIGATGADPAPQTMSGDATLAANGALTLASDIKVKAWIHFNGTGTIAINDSYNVSSIVDNGTGDYTINWDTDFAYATYPWGGYARSGADILIATHKKATSPLAGSINLVTVKTTDETGVDANQVGIIAIGDQ